MSHLSEASSSCRLGTPGRYGKAPRRARRWWALAGHLMLAVTAASGCAKARAASVPQSPPLAVPEPPARVLVPVTDEPIATLPGPDTSLTSAPAVPTPPRSRPRTAAPAASESNTPDSTPPAAAA
jgi:hypothetical protein